METALNPEPHPDSAYVMSYFTESPDGLGTHYGLHLAVSTDARHWMPLNQNLPVITPTEGAGGLRDPFVMRKQDGTFVVLATDLVGFDWDYTSQYIHVWDSADLRAFTGYRRLRLHDMVTHSWAPEAYWDAGRGQYAILSSSVAAGGHNVIMVNYTTDFREVTPPQVFFDPGYDVIDANMTLDIGGVNYMYFKNSSDHALVGARSTSLDPGSFTVFSTPVAQGGTEAPAVIRPRGSDAWYLWGDTYTPNGVYYAWQTSDLASGTWTAANMRDYTQPLNSKHCAMETITRAEYDNLVAHYGRPAWNRLKSYSHPDRYVSHADRVGRLNTYPFDPYTHALWKLVPGLADSSGVSFQSVDDPALHLRQDGHDLRLEAADGSAAFDRDATFHRTAGLADPAWSSFRSYASPDRYLRHAGDAALRVEPISTAADRADATFHVGH